MVNIFATQYSIEQATNVAIIHIIANLPFISLVLLARPNRRADKYITKYRT
ncbi:hypothetical protein KDD93_02850 [Campylobacter sp. faydin G-24]|uniref:Uncharacterized protein n=1 Tax=Campylobacter anatolicus TaxID=2829105 RepID=A0ABS5HGV9_9BACT|nr:hypothetical protein [Campylobacter anatolicus]MBR8461773.1 hypothetical protein [Campylobacter anatolicus]MBR8463508.1 hypothetical protein [Campylobacter anatolicus]